MKITDDLIPQMEDGDTKGSALTLSQVNFMLKEIFEKMPILYSTDTEIHWTKLDGYKTVHSAKGRLMGPVYTDTDSYEKVLTGFVSLFESGGKDPKELIRRTKHLLKGGK
jgi:hypothetical protein